MARPKKKAEDKAVSTDSVKHGSCAAPASSGLLPEE